MDDTDQDNNNKMDLAFNEDLDSSLLHWDSATPTGVDKDSDAKVGGNDTNSMSHHSPRSNGHGASWDSSNGAAGFSQLPAFTMEEERQKFGKTNCNSSNSTTTNNNNNGSDGTAAASSQPTDGASSQSWQTMQQKAQQQQDQQQQDQQQLMVAAAGAVHENMIAAMANNGTNEQKTPAHADTQQQNNGTPQQASIKNDSSQSQQQQQQQQQQANQLSNALQMASDSMTAATANNTQMHPLAISSAANCPPHVIAAHQMQAVAGMQNALFPVAALSTLGANAAAAFAAAGFALPSVPTTDNNQNTNTSQQAHQQQQQLNANALLFSAQALQLQQQQQSNNTNVNLQQQQQAPQTSTDTGATNSPPPFYLFDAPAELRINFMQSQRMHGLPVTEDNNSYHYGVAVNGFHPQLNAQLNPAAAGNMQQQQQQQHVVGASGSVTASSTCGSRHNQAGASVQLIDARHSNRKSGRIKNEREQRRAQKITELIDQLREKMETGGWKVEMKSKFHTLSS